MQPNKVDHTVRWDIADYTRLQASAQEMGISAGGLVRWLVLAWLRREGERPLQLEAPDGK